MKGETVTGVQEARRLQPQAACKATTRRGVATCNDGRVVEDHGQTIRIFVPMELRKRSGRKVIIEPDAPHDDNEPSPLVVALARAYVWQQAIDRADFPNAQALADHFNVDASLVRRILRLGGISPRIVEAALDGKEPDISLQALLDMDVPVGWAEQEGMFRSDEATG